MEKQMIPQEPVTSYKEIRIGRTIYRVTSFFSGEKDLARRWSSLPYARPWRRSPPPPHPKIVKHTSWPAASLRGGGVLCIMFLWGTPHGAITPHEV